MNTAALLARLRNRADVEYAEPNFIIRIGAQPNDPSFGQLWGLQNTGQTINFFPGVAGADIDAVPRLGSDGRFDRARRRRDRHRHRLHASGSRRQHLVGPGGSSR